MYFRINNNHRKHHSSSFQEVSNSKMKKGKFSTVSHCLRVAWTLVNLVCDEKRQFNLHFIASFSDKLFIIGGRSNGVATETIQVFDTSRRQMLSTALKLTEARIRPSVFLSGYIIFVIGGMGKNGKPLGTWEGFNTCENT